MDYSTLFLSCMDYSTVGVRDASNFVVSVSDLFSFEFDF
jgi:hypothetical protein